MAKTDLRRAYIKLRWAEAEVTEGDTQAPSDTGAIWVRIYTFQVQARSP